MKKKIKVVIKKKDTSLGEFGEIKEVAAGFARNFLIPQGFALYLSDPRSKEILRQKESIEKEKEKEIQEIKKQANKIAQKVLLIKAKVTEKGKLYAAIDKEDIAQYLQKEFSMKVPKNHLQMEKIKEPGEQEITLNLGHNIVVPLKLKIEGIK